MTPTPADALLLAFGATIDRARLDRDWSVTRLAFEAGLSRNTVRGVLNLRSGDRVNVGTVAKLFEALAITVRCEQRNGRQSAA